MTERYAHLAPERVRAAVAVLDADEETTGEGPATALRAVGDDQRQPRSMRS
jgi:hypothetical protein